MARTKTINKFVQRLFVVGCVVMIMQSFRTPGLTVTETIVAPPAPESRNFDLANEESFGFFDDIDESNWKILKRIAAEMVNHKREDPLYPLPLDNSTHKPWRPYFAWYQEVSSRALLYCDLFLLDMSSSRFYILFSFASQSNQ